jgi:hypothetical protein
MNEDVFCGTRVMNVRIARECEEFLWRQDNA